MEPAAKDRVYMAVFLAQSVYTWGQWLSRVALSFYISQNGVPHQVVHWLQGEGDLDLGSGRSHYLGAEAGLCWFSRLQDLPREHLYALAEDSDGECGPRPSRASRCDFA